MSTTMNNMSKKKSFSDTFKRSFTDVCLKKNFSFKAIPSTINEQSRTFKACFTTDEPVRYQGFLYTIMEVLKIDNEALDASRVDDGGMPYLKNHDNNIDSVIGTIRSYEIVSVENRTELRGTVQISKAEDPEEDKEFQKYFNRIKRGELINNSIGYRVYRWEESEIVDDENVITFTAVDWELLEVSLVAVPADKFATIRGFGKNNLKKDEKKIENTLEKAGELKNNSCNDKEIPKTKDCKMPPIDKKDDEKGLKPDENKSEPGDSGTENIVKKGLDKKEVQEIEKICRNAELDFGDCVEKELTVDEVRKLALEKVFAKQTKVKAAADKKVNIDVGETGVEKMNRDFSDLLLFKMNRKKSLEKDTGFDMRMSFIDMVKKYVNQPFANSRELLKRTVFTGNLSNLITDTLNNELRRDYMERTFSYAPLVRSRGLDNLHDAKVTAVDASLIPVDMGEGEEYKLSEIKDNQDVIKIIKRGKAISISEESFLSDNLDGLSRIITKFGYGMRLREAELIFGLLTSNTATVEGQPIFHTSHDNTVTGATGGITIKNVADARLKMKLQKSLADDPVRIEPRHIVCAEALGLSAAQFLQDTFVPQEYTQQTQVYRNGIRSVISDSNLDVNLAANAATTWFLAADSSETDIIQRVYLNDYPTPELKSKYIDERDSMVWMVKFFVGFGIVDYRGLVRISA